MWQDIWTWVITNLPKLVMVAAVLIVGFKLVDLLERIVINKLEKKDFDKTSITFIINGVKIVLKAIIIMSALKMLGVDTSSFTAVLATFSLCLGLSVQNIITNLCSGLMLIFFKPFKTGDVIECKGQKGVVTVIGMTNSTILTEDNKTIIMPNSYLASDTVINYSAFDQDQAKKEADAEKMAAINDKMNSLKENSAGLLKKIGIGKDEEGAEN